jgi:hypothetical protein
VATIRTGIIPSQMNSLKNGIFMLLKLRMNENVIGHPCSTIRVMGSDYKIVVAKFENTNKILADE